MDKVSETITTKNKIEMHTLGLNQFPLVGDITLVIIPILVCPHVFLTGLFLSAVTIKRVEAGCSPYLQPLPVLLFSSQF